VSESTTQKPDETTTSTGTTTTVTSQAAPDVQALMAKVASLEKQLSDKMSSQGGMDLNEKVKLEREDKDKKSSETKLLEAAWSFNHTSAEFLRQNESVMPSEISEIFKAAEREKYESAVQKANATKSAIIQCFFSQQANLDLLTESGKNRLADFLKLTKNGKEERANDTYENIFEPALSTLKKVKKAEELTRSKMGFRDGKGDGQYKEKLMNLSRQHYLGEKNNVKSV
jgi:hypothetical protein